MPHKYSGCTLSVQVHQTQTIASTWDLKPVSPLWSKSWGGFPLISTGIKSGGGGGKEKSVKCEWKCWRNFPRTGCLGKASQSVRRMRAPAFIQGVMMLWGGKVLENQCLRCRGLSATDRLASRSNSIASRALLCLKRFTYSAVFVKFARHICPGSHFREWEQDDFFRLEFWGFAFLICLRLAWKQLSRSSVGIKQTDYEAGSMFWRRELSSWSRECRDVHQQSPVWAICPVRVGNLNCWVCCCCRGEMK